MDRSASRRSIGKLEFIAQMETMRVFDPPLVIIIVGLLWLSRIVKFGTEITVSLSSMNKLKKGENYILDICLFETGIKYLYLVVNFIIVLPPKVGCKQSIVLTNLNQRFNKVIG